MSFDFQLSSYTVNRVCTMVLRFECVYSGYITGLYAMLTACNMQFSNMDSTNIEHR